MDRAYAINRRKEVIFELNKEGGKCFFGPGGSHEYTQEGYEAAQESIQNRERLRSELSTLNGFLGFKVDDDRL